MDNEQLFLVLVAVAVAAALIIGAALSNQPGSAQPSNTVTNAPDAEFSIDPVETESGIRVEFTLMSLQDADAVVFETETTESRRVEAIGQETTYQNLAHGDRVYIYAVQDGERRLVDVYEVWRPSQTE